MQAWKTDPSNGTHVSVLNEVCWAEMISERNDHNSMHGLKLNDFKVNRLVSGNMYSGVAKLCHDSCTTGICRSTGRSAIIQMKQNRTRYLV